MKNLEYRINQNTLKRVFGDVVELLILDSKFLILQTGGL